MIRLLCKLWMGKEPDDAQAIVQSDDDESFLREVFTVEKRLPPRTNSEAATVDPHEHGQASTR